ncbi:hypothetical protein GSI_06350 [Ganoderma sinense ZZ0214-1]|uniref:Uncharacterized protein n=1 Tax=Ganoderma sinense ZZ0214-1 TaxID=1077348 RepID=A0A2G8SDI4_9APHY|nr:hypothetical protein GSI_06350 [Ganoderma sinense ZZ0214-1]
MNVMNSPVDYRAHDDHLKHLLDQRAARADLHARFPSLSEFSDSPSVYSHPQFSPCPQDRMDGQSHSFRFPRSPNAYTPSLSEPRSPISDRERLNIPTASSLDLDDDPRSSSELNSIRDGQDPDDPPHDPEDEPRISIYGPKMRFHSPAPWEEDDLDSKSVVEQPSISKRVKKKSESNKKGWPLSRVSTEPRPSTDSTRSAKPKQSFDAASTISANGALAALAQASMSSTSLGIHQSPHSLRDKLSLPRLRSRTTSNNVGHHDPFSPSNASPINRIATPPHQDMYGDSHAVFGHSSSPSTGSSHPEYSHPYANPDLARSIDSDPQLPSPSGSGFGATRTDSSATLTETTPSSSMSQFRSTTTLGLSPGTSTTSMNPSLNESASSRFKGISSPMPVDKASLHPEQLNKLNGFQSPITPASSISPLARSRDIVPQVGVPMGGLNAWEAASPSSNGGGGGALKLISLEEAQAQARERSRSQTAQPAISSPFTTVRPQFPESEMDVQRGQGRARSSSAGGLKGRTVFESPQRGTAAGPGDSPINGPSRQVARKKSGFMRLFNGKERVSPSSPPPPVPTFTQDAFAAISPPPPSQYSRPRQGSAHRVPVPPLSPGDGGSPADSPPASSSDSSASNSSGMREHLSVRRKVPELSIVTTQSTTSLSAKVPHTAPLSGGSSDYTHHHLTPTNVANRPESRSNGGSPISAPSSKTDFVGLSIRPMSTLFTTELKELADKEDPSLAARPSLDIDTGTPTTATTVISPLSPDFPGVKPLGFGRSSDEKSGHISIAQEDRDQSSIIQALQEQILSTRRAWQRQIWELEGQVRDLKAEVEELRAAESQSEFCAACGRGAVGRPAAPSPNDDSYRTIEDAGSNMKKAGGVVNRPRARTGVGSRFAARE